MRDRGSSVRSRSCTSHSDVQRTRSWRSDSLYSWSSSYLAPFCTCALFLVIFPWLISNSSRYFIERGTWDDTLEVFINSDGDSSQFAVSPFAQAFSYLSLTAHILVYTRRSVVRNPFSVQSPCLTPAPLLGLSSSVSEVLEFASIDRILDT